MRSEDAQAFEAVMQDLCLAFNRPYTTELSKSFWEPLKFLHVLDLKRAAEAHKRNGKKFPAPKDLMPERAAAKAPKVVEQLPQMSAWAIGANKILMRALMTCGGVSLACMTQLVSAKDDFGSMAETDQANGEPWTDADFIAAIEDSAEKIIKRNPETEDEREARVAEAIAEWRARR